MRIPFRVERKIDGSTNILSTDHVLPSDSLFSTGREIGGLDTKIFVTNSTSSLGSSGHIHY